MPVPPPTLPSGTAPSAAARAAAACAAVTCWPLTSLRQPSQVSPTTGRLQKSLPGPRASISRRAKASRTTPTECVLVSATGEVSSPDSRIHSRPVSSPLPLSRWQPAKSGSSLISPSCGNTTVTPVRTGPSPTRSGPSPSISVACPTRTPATSVIAFSGPGRPRPSSMPTSRALTRIPSRDPVCSLGLFGLYPAAQVPHAAQQDERPAQAEGEPLPVDERLLGGDRRRQRLDKPVRVDVVVAVEHGLSLIHIS